MLITTKITCLTMINQQPNHTYRPWVDSLDRKNITNNIINYLHIESIVVNTFTRLKKSLLSGRNILNIKPY